MTHTFSKKQILNITTGRLHTSMDDIYKFFNDVIDPGIMTHMLPNASKAIEPILLPKLPGIETEGYYPEATGTISFEFTDEDKASFWKNYSELPSLLEWKKVIVVTV